MPDCVLTINGGSSSIKFAAYRAGAEPQRLLSGAIERIGGGDAVLIAGAEGESAKRQPIGATDHGAAARALIDWLRPQLGTGHVIGIGHRIVHGGVKLLEHQRVTPELIAELRRIEELDLAHLPGEIALIEAMGKEFPESPQVACFDTAFHREMPRVAKSLPIPRRYEAAGVQRFGFHGLSYAYLMGELERANAAQGRIVLAHLGAGASMAAVRDGRPIDTTMGFTPTAGLVMATRPGDLDPGLLTYLMQVEKLSAKEMDDFINKRCGLLGLSETTSDMRDLIARRAMDVRAAEAVELFCYSARKWIGALAAVMGGLNTLVFSGGIGEHSTEVRAEICAGLEFLGVQLDPSRNANGAGVISTDDGRVSVRVMETNEEIVIARTVCKLLGLTDA
jgi:acetate kinase